MFLFSVGNFLAFTISQQGIDWHVDVGFTLFLLRCSSVSYKTDVFASDTEHGTMYK